MRFLLDENVNLGLLNWLREAGHDAKRVPLGIENGEVARLAMAEERVLITYDCDFTDREAFSPRSHAGIIFVSIRPRSMEKLATILSMLLAQVPAERLGRGLFLLEEGKFQEIA